jgi:NAD(P)-dependent dehydrogenase (short-subunit alcohol dehydrogenase family)
VQLQRARDYIARTFGVAPVGLWPSEGSVSDEALAIAADVTEEDEVAGYVRACLDRFGSIDVFYNNAGVEGDIKPITAYSLESFRRVLDVNVVGVFLGMKHVLPVMLKNDRGSIINTASSAGLVGSPDIAVYTASKHAVIGLTKAAAVECGGTLVRVNCVCPGMIDSRMLSAIIEGRNPGNAPVPNERIVERIPARRLGHASEVASIVAFLASDEASYVSGSAYTVDGGRTAG